MKIQFTQSFAIDDKEFKVKKKGKAEVADAPLYFVFVAFFAALFNDGKIKILDVDQAELSELAKEEEKYKAFKVDSAIEAEIEQILMKKESKEEGEKEDETNSDSSDVSDSGSQSEDSKEHSPNEHAESNKELHQGEKSSEEVLETKTVIEEQHIEEADGDVKDIKKTTTTTTKKKK